MGTIKKDSVSIAKHIKSLEERMDFLEKKIIEDKDGDGVLGFRCQEWNALKWATDVLKVINWAGGFSEAKND